MSKPSSTPNFQLFSSLRYDPLLTTISANTANWPTPNPPPSSPFYMLPHHRDRMLEAAEHFKWEHAAAKIRGPEGFTHLLETLNTTINTTSDQPLKVRTLLSYDGTITIESNPVPAVSQFTLFPHRIPPSRGEVEQTMSVSSLTGGTLTTGANDTIYGDPPMTTQWTVIPDAVATPPSPYTSYKTTERDMYNGARSRVGIENPTDAKEVLLVSEFNNGEIMEGSLTTVYFWRGGKWVTPDGKCGGQLGTTRRWALEKGLCVEGVVRKGELVDGEECWFSNGVRGFQWGKVKLT